MKPILRRDRRNTLCRISSRIPFFHRKRPLSSIVWTNWPPLRTSSTIRFQVTGDWSFKKTADGHTNHPCFNLVTCVWENAEREKKKGREKERERGIIDRLDFAPSIFVDSMAILFIHQCFRIRFLSDDLYFSFWSAIIGQVCSTRMKWDNLRIGKLTKF